MEISTFSKTYTVIIPNRFDDVIQPLLTSIKEFESTIPNIVIIADGHDRNYGYDIVKVSGKFNFSRSVNAGINYASPDDIILINDDVRLLQPNTFKTLHDLAYTRPALGILSPMVYGGCGNPYMRPSNTHLWDGSGRGRNIENGIHYCNAKSGDRITFACVYIKRKLLNKMGLFDENFTGYGFDDADICVRAIKCCWEIGITNKLIVQHGDGGEQHVRGKNWSTSFSRIRSGGSRENLNYFLTKHAT